MKTLRFRCLGAGCLLMVASSLPAQLGVVVVSDPQRDAHQFPLQMLKWGKMLEEHYNRYRQIEEQLRRAGDAAVFLEHLQIMPLHQSNLQTAARNPRSSLMEAFQLDWERLNQTHYTLPGNVTPQLRQSWRLGDTMQEVMGPDGRMRSVPSAFSRIGSFRFQTAVQRFFRDYRGHLQERDIEPFRSVAERQDLYRVFSGAADDHSALLASEAEHHGNLMDALGHRPLNQAELDAARLSLESSRLRLEATTGRVQSAYYQLAARRHAEEAEAEKRKLAEKDVRQAMEEGMETSRRETALREANVQTIPAEGLRGHTLPPFRIP